MQKLFPSILVLSILLTSCGGGQNQAEKAGMAMAETACLLFDDTADLANLEAQTNEIMTKYGWENPEAIDTYLTSVQETSEKNDVSVATRDHLEKTCGDRLKEKGVTAADLAEAMVSQ